MEMGEGRGRKERERTLHGLVDTPHVRNPEKYPVHWAARDIVRGERVGKLRDERWESKRNWRKGWIRLERRYLGKGHERGWSIVCTTV